MFFSKIGEYEASGIYSLGHLCLFIITIIAISIALIISIKKHVDVKKVIKNVTMTMLILELTTILFKIIHYGCDDIGSFSPIYYCSAFLFAGALSSCAKGNLKRVGDVFLATGGIVGGITFLLFPTTSLPDYPAFHFISIHSFIFHGSMIYLGLLIYITNYIQLELKDLIYHAYIISTLCLISLIMNSIFNTNFMFISKDFPGTFVGFLYQTTGALFTPIAVISQIIIPFFMVYLVTLFIKQLKPIK